MARGRKLTTGKYQTREELIDNIIAFEEMGHNFSQIARICRISQTTAIKLWDENKKRKLK